MSDPLILIGLSGPAGCGKTTVAKLLEERFEFTSMAFADPIRAACRALFPDWGPEHFERPHKEALCPEHGVSPRHAMRVIGEFARHLDEEIYAVHLRDRLFNVIYAGRRCIVVTDVRFEAESDLIRRPLLDRGECVSCVVHIERPGVEWSYEHASEFGPEPKPSDLVIRNDGDVSNLTRAVDALVAEVAPWIQQSRPA